LHYFYIDKASWDAELKDAGEKERYNGAGNVNPLEGTFGTVTRNLFIVQQQDLNPMATVIAIGSTLFYVASTLLAAGLIANIWIPGTFEMALSLGIPLMIGAYLLAVLLPVALFINFLFAVIEWVISVFEAVVGMPLWALSFITVGGDGIGDKAFNGVMKLFEIMLRPSVIVTVTVASFIIFSAAVHFFNNAFGMFYQSYMDVTTVGGSALMFIGSLFMYVMTVYSIGNSCFKLIPTISNQFMGWIGGPQGFSHTMDFKMEEVSGIGAIYALDKFGGGISRGASQMGKGIKAIGKDRKERKMGYEDDADMQSKLGREDQAQRTARAMRDSGIGGNTTNNYNIYGSNPPGGGGAGRQGRQSLSDRMLRDADDAEVVE